MGDLSFFLMLHDLADAETPLIAGLAAGRSRPRSDAAALSPAAVPDRGRARRGRW